MLKERLGKEDSELVTNCHQLKLGAADADGKKYMADVASSDVLLPLIQGNFEWPRQWRLCMKRGEDSNALKEVWKMKEDA